MNTKDEEALSYLYKLCIETRNFEITQLVARNNFFMIFQGMLFAGLAQASGTAPPIVCFIVCIVGVLVSCMQAFMASGAKYWQNHWEEKLEAIESKLIEKLKLDKEQKIRELDPIHMFSKELEPLELPTLPPVKPGFFTELLVRRFSVSRIPIYAGYLLLICWTILFLCTVAGPWGRLVPLFVVGFPR